MKQLHKSFHPAVCERILMLSHKYSYQLVLVVDWFSAVYVYSCVYISCVIYYDLCVLVVCVFCSLTLLSFPYPPHLSLLFACMPTVISPFWRIFYAF